ncbi:hypothetical protein GN138_09515 [Winogradskyella sp. HL2-2]|uniref:Uncharacterized protein n=2 Tax=Winogradskyella endarachnes TaxID=2681965 RepID=A0A6L6U8K7_9FLAO|nr:hypothetical protein [Winogradskyella endarachnes]
MIPFKILVAMLFALSLTHCSNNDNNSNSDTDEPSTSEYDGTASVTQGFGTTTAANLFPQGQRVAAMGTITASDNTVWTVPADVNYTDDSFPFAPDLNNPYGTQYASASAALAAFDENDIIEVDASGEVITAYLFADNYFELYVNGIPVGKDAVPFTEFNSHIVKFRVNTPFTIAMKLVDWEENLGLGSENQATPYHPGDGGMIAVFMDENENIIASTGSDWKAQTFYTAPIQDLSCPTENGTARSTTNCSTADATDGSNFHGLHWEVPTNWNSTGFDDSNWPSATVYTSSELGMDNKIAYTTYLDVFDNAEFIWSTNVILDNEVIVRYNVE